MIFFPILRHVINLLTVVKSFGYNQLVTALPEDGTSLSGSGSVVVFDNADLSSVAVILHFLEERLSIEAGRPTDDQLTPVLCTLTEAAKTVPVIRRYLKANILPPLRENLHQRPEVGGTMRNKVCRLLTSTQMNVRDGAGDFLFALCKGNGTKSFRETSFHFLSILLLFSNYFCIFTFSQFIYGLIFHREFLLRSFC